MNARADRRALREHVRSGELSLGRWLWQLASATVHEDFTLRDPGPGLAALCATVGRRLRRLLGAAAHRIGRRPCTWR
jgi:hypothetical protein